MAAKSSSIMILYLLCCYFLFVMPSYAEVDVETDTLLQGQTLGAGEYLTSANKIFRLQFFSSASSIWKYLGIVYNIQGRSYSGTGNYKPVWVANRDGVFSDSLLMLMIDPTDGLLKISNYGRNTTVSNSSTPISGAKNTTATLLDNGNFVLRMLNPDGSINRTLWQSFDYPTDTFLSGMKLGVNFRTGHKWSLTCWASNELPDSGSFTLGLDGNPNGSSQLVIWWHGKVYWTSGPWDKGKFKNTDLFGEDMKFTYVLNENENYLTYSGDDQTFPLAKFRMESNGMIDNFYSDPYPNCLMNPRSRADPNNFLA